MDQFVSKSIGMIPEQFQIYAERTSRFTAIFLTNRRDLLDNAMSRGEF